MPGCGFPGLKGRTIVYLFFLFFYYLVALVTKLTEYDYS
jgi:hypothetical protein